MHNLLYLPSTVLVYGAFLTYEWAVLDVAVGHFGPGNGPLLPFAWAVLVHGPFWYRPKLCKATERLVHVSNLALLLPVGTWTAVVPRYCWPVLKPPRWRSRCIYAHSWHRRCDRLCCARTTQQNLQQRTRIQASCSIQSTDDTIKMIFCIRATKLFTFLIHNSVWYVAAYF